MKLLVKTIPALLIVFGLLLAGCGGAATLAPVPTEPPATSNATEVPTAEPVTLVVWSMYNEGETMQVWEAAAIEAFEAANPNVTIEVTWAGRDVIGVTLRNALMAKSALPDIIDQSNPNLVKGPLSEDLGLPLEDYLTTPAYNSEVAWGETFIPSVMDFLKYNDHSYMIPRMVYSSGFFYNKKIFTDNNITIPTTWTEFLAVCAQLKAAGITPVLTDNDPEYIIWPYTMSALRTAGPTGLYDTLADKTAEKWKDPALLEAAQMIDQLNDYYQDGYGGSTWPAAQLEFVQGRGAMMFMGAWLPSEMLKDTPEGFEMDIFPFPNTGGPGDNVSEAWSNSWMVLNTSEHPDTAVAFLKFLTSAEQMQGVLDAGAPVPLVGFPMPKNLSGLSGILGVDQLVPRESGMLQDFSSLYFDTIGPVPYAPLWLGTQTPADFIPAAMDAQIQYYQANP
jgi:raffinose/stachyose/melibiose transport system substrate-binding protein